MSARKQETGEFGQLVDDFLADNLADEGLTRLESHLQGNRAAQQFFLKYCQLHIDLTVDSCAASAVERFCEQQNRTIGLQYASPVSRMISWSRASQVVRNWSTMSLACAAALLLVVIGAAVRDWTAGSPPFSVAPLAEQSKTKAGESTATAPAIAQKLPVIKSLSTKGPTTRMELEGIGHVYLDSQSEFNFVGPHRARLKSGRMRMRVTEESGRGFVVETPDGDITDLGTEFGVEVGQGRSSALAVFEGAVDLKIAGLARNSTRIERLLGGDGVLFSKNGQLDRINSIMAGEGARFQVCGEPSPFSFDDPVIVDVYDNLPPKSTRRYYEIVARGLREDALAFVDRPEHNWNGLSKHHGLPGYLEGADYVKTFNDDKRRKFAMSVVLSRPATVYILYDKRLTVPNWLAENYERLEESMGLDTGRLTAAQVASKSPPRNGTGPGESIDHEFAIWKRVVTSPGEVVLGENGVNKSHSDLCTMYGVAAKELKPEPSSKSAKRKSVRASSRVSHRRADGS